MIDDARDRPVEVNSIDRKRARRSRLPDRPKSVLDGTFQECLLTTAHICRISLFDEWKLCSLSKPELNAHVGRVPRATPVAHVAFIIAIESKVREDGPE